MIPSNELRIGNWIHEADGNGQVTVIDAEWITTNCTNLSLPIECFTPIPLTPEVLEKCGFDWIIWDGNEHHKVLSYKNTPIHTYWDGSDWCFKYGFDSDLTFAACQYVHQLQNLIHVLTGEELTVNL